MRAEGGRKKEGKKLIFMGELFPYYLFLDFLNPRSNSFQFLLRSPYSALIPQKLPPPSSTLRPHPSKVSPHSAFRTHPSKPACFKLVIDRVKLRVGLEFEGRVRAVPA